MSVPVVQCRAMSRTGKRCKNKAIPGGTVCRFHGGASPHVASKAAVRAEVMAWGLNEAHDDPGEVLLRLVSQSRKRADLYAQLLQEAFDAAERLKRAHEAGAVNVDEGNPMAETAREDLDRIFNTGGVAALVGNTYGATKDVRIYVTGEAIRGLADLEAKERERCANFAAKAVAAGLMKRQVELAEAQGQLMAKAIRAILDRLSLTPEQRRLAAEVVREELLAVAA
jgi:hypothetical protein